MFTHERRRADVVYGERFLSDPYLDEEWAFVFGFPWYMISTHGRVWSELSHEFVKPYQMNNAGHLGVSLRKNNMRHHRYIHRLIAQAFIPNPLMFPEVRHLDDDPSNNYLENLAWGTRIDNIEDARFNGHLGNNVVAIHEATGIRTIFETQIDAARHLNMSTASVSFSIKDGRCVFGYRFERAS